METWSIRAGGIALALVASAWVLPAADPEEGGDLLRMVGQVDGQMILEQDLDRRVAAIQEVAGGDPAILRAEVLSEMVDELILVNRALELRVNEEKVYRKARQQFMERSGIESEEALEAHLRLSGMEIDDFRRIILRNYIPALVLAREVHPLPGDYEENLDAYMSRLREEAKIWIHPDYTALPGEAEG
jgi:hypothetical protein